MANRLSSADVERFYMTRNELASQGNSRLELEAMSLVREYLANYQDETPSTPVAPSGPVIGSANKATEEEGKENK